MKNDPYRPEERWQRSKNPGRLVNLLYDRGVDRARKSRLIAVACCRQAWAKLDTEKQQALEVIENFADGNAKYTEMRRAVQGMRIPGYASQPMIVEAARQDGKFRLLSVIMPLLGVSWHGEPKDIEEEYDGVRGGYWREKADWDRACATFCQIIRDSFAYVFHSVSLLPTWRTTAVQELARPLINSATCRQGL